MSRVRRSAGGIGKMDRPSRLLLFVRRRRRMVAPALFVAVLLTAVGSGLYLWHTTRTPAGFAPWRAEIGRAAGLPIRDIIIQGRNMTPENQVMSALGVAIGAPLLGFSLEAARLRIDRLSFVEHSTVERRLPGTVLVQLTERRPFAVWQNQKHFVLIDRQGRVVEQQGMSGGGMNGAGISAKDADALETLPLVVGAGAPQAATALIDALADEPSVRRQVVAAERIGQRRWNLKLKSGDTVLLPEAAEIPALRRLAQLEADTRLLERPLAAIDMRLPDRLVLRDRVPPETSPGTPAGTPSASIKQGPA